MNVYVKLDCKVGNKAELLKHQSAVLTASMIVTTYNESKEYLLGVGPELFVEQWMRSYLTLSDTDFGDLIMIYFVKILQATQNE